MRHGRLSGYSNVAPAPLSIRIGRRKKHRWSPEPTSPAAESPSEPIVRKGPNSYDLFCQKEKRGPKRFALITTLALYPLLLLVRLPAAKAPIMENKQENIVYVRRWIPPLPPVVERPKQVIQEDLRARKVPVPDPTPNDPEPVQEPELEPDPIPVAPDVEIVIGTPVPPPVQDGPLQAGVGGVTYPVLIESTKVVPIYPDLARKAKVTGNVILEAVIYKDGTVGNVKVLRSPGANLGFERSAMEAVTRWRFRPAMLDGRAVDTYFTVVVEFVLN
jgi:protein TonB